MPPFEWLSAERTENDNKPGWSASLIPKASYCSASGGNVRASATASDRKRCLESPGMGGRRVGWQLGCISNHMTSVWRDLISISGKVFSTSNSDWLETPVWRTCHHNNVRKFLRWWVPCAFANPSWRERSHFKSAPYWQMQVDMQS